MRVFWKMNWTWWYWFKNPSGRGRVTQLDLHFSERSLQAVRKPLQFLLVMVVAIGGDLIARLLRTLTVLD